MRKCLDERRCPIDPITERKDSAISSSCSSGSLIIWLSTGLLCHGLSADFLTHVSLGQHVKAGCGISRQHEAARGLPTNPARLVLTRCSKSSELTAGPFRASFAASDAPIKAALESVKLIEASEAARSATDRDHVMNVTHALWGASYPSWVGIVESAESDSGLPTIALRNRGLASRKEIELQGRSQMSDTLPSTTTARSDTAASGVEDSAAADPQDLRRLGGRRAAHGSACLARRARAR